MDERLRLIVDSMKILSAEPDEQVAYLERLGISSGVDELALEYDDIAPAVEAMFESGELTPEQLEAVRALSAQLKKMSGAENAHLWTVHALSSSAEWVNVRRLAEAGLKQLGVEGNLGKETWGQKPGDRRNVLLQQVGHL